ncbi:MAG: hypothetical protein Q9216_001515 [Gyalolechia sp. 2 TL-2023]
MNCSTPLKRRRSTSPQSLEPSTSIPPNLPSEGTKHIRRSYSSSSFQQDCSSNSPDAIQSFNPHQPIDPASIDSIANERPPHPVQPSTQPCLEPLRLSPPQPLTRANLKQLTSDLTPPSQQRRPSQSQTETMAPSNSSNATDPAIAWMHLRRNYIYHNDARGESLGEGIIKEARTIVDGFRKSAMTEEEQQRIQTTINKNKFKGELTFLFAFWQVLLKKDRLKRPDQTDQEWILSAWTEDGLAMAMAWRHQFDPKWIPQLDPHDDPWGAGKSLPKVKTPHPDILHAYEDWALPTAVLDAVQAFECIPSGGMYLPWFSIAAKGATHSIEQVELQCAPAGAGMVFHLREFFNFLRSRLASYEKEVAAASTTKDENFASIPAAAAATHQSTSATTPTFEPYADGSAIAFTLAVVPSKAHLFVHFAEQHTATQTHYHMHYVGSYDFMKLEDFKLLRKHIENILDWGLRERKDDLEVRCEPLYEMVRMAKKRKADGGAEDVGCRT